MRSWGVKELTGKGKPNEMRWGGGGESNLVLDKHPIQGGVVILLVQRFMPWKPGQALAGWATRPEYGPNLP